MSWKKGAASAVAEAPQMMPGSKGLVSIVILNWNGKKDLQRCIPALWKNTLYKKFEVIVVDNGSTDGSIELMQEMKSKGKVHTIVLNNKNLGFAGGNNKGIGQAKGEYVFLLNNDTAVTRGWLEPLVKIARERRNVGIIGPWFPNAENQDTIFGPGFIDNAGRSRNTFKRGDCEGEIVSGGAFFVKREVIERIGLLDEKFFPIYFEESDYCARARKAGFRVWFTAKSKIIHFESAATAKQPSKWMFIALNKNRGRFMLIHFPKKRLLKAFFWETLRIVKSAFSRPFIWLLQSYWQNIKNLPEILAKRRLYNSEEFGKKREGKASTAQRIAEEEWNEIALGNDNFFLSLGWVTPWLARAEEQGAQPFIVEAREQGKLVGIAPLVLKGRSLEFLGQQYSCHLDFLAEKGKEKAAAEKIIGQVFENAGKWNRVSFQHLVARPAFLSPLEKKCRQYGFVLQQEQGDSASVVELPASLTQYFAGLKKKKRKNLRNDLSRLSREFKVQTEVIADATELPSAWRNFLQLHFENMQRKQSRSILEQQWFQKIYYAACESAAREGKLRFVNLKLNGRLAGSLLAIMHRQWFGVLNIGTSKDYDARQSLGTVLFLKAIEYCCDNGIRFFDLLLGGPEYKARFGAVQRSGLVVRVFKSGQAAAADELKRFAKKSAKRAVGR